MTPRDRPITPGPRIALAADAPLVHTWSVSEASPERAASPVPRAGPGVVALATAPVPRRQAIFIVAVTVLGMSLLLGRNDTSRGPLWHMMWMVSLVVVLGGVLSTLARLLRPAGAPTTPAPLPADTPERP